LDLGELAMLSAKRLYLFKVTVVDCRNGREDLQQLGIVAEGCQL
jgi:hypothetical protein